MSRYRFALRPRWILSHLFVLAMVITMVNLGLWQLDRLEQRRDRNARVSERMAEAPVPADGLVEPGDDAAVAALEFRTVTATGTYLRDEEVLVRSRSLDGAPGSWVLTPLLLDDGTAVVVNRGWVQNNGRLTSVPEELGAPAGEVTVGGLVRRSETKGRFGSTDPTAGQLANLARADVARIDAQVDEDLLPFYVQLLEQDPAIADDDPQPVPAPPLDEGPHLSYAFQWFTFTLLTLIFYPLILRRRAREIEKEEREAALEPEPSG